jgi:hypothetical protein
MEIKKKIPFSFLLSSFANMKKRNKWKYWLTHDINRSEMFCTGCGIVS